MPRKIKFTQDDIINAGIDIVRKYGEDKLSAREISRVLNSSVCPLFTYFDNMQDIKDEVRRKAMNLYNEYIFRCKYEEGKEYRNTGLAYIRFAKDEPNLFKMLCMCNKDNMAHLSGEDLSLEYIIDLICRNTNLDRFKAKSLHTHLWIYVHGLATMVVTNSIDFSKEQLENLLSEEYYAILKIYGVK